MTPEANSANKPGGGLRRRIVSRLRSPLLSGVAGGAIVAVFGWVAISAGWIEASTDTSSQALAPAPLTQPASDSGSAKTISPAQIYAEDGPGVVHIDAGSQDAALGQGTATGSGFLIDAQGHIVTNAHVVEGSDQLQVSFEENSDPVTAKLVGVDPSTDIAVLQADVPSEHQHPLPLGSSGAVQVGSPVVAIGNPFGLDRTVTSGIVSAVQRQIQAPNNFTISNAIQTDAPINPGNSGGPLIDATGRVIGVNSQIATGGGNGSVGIGFAVPIDTVRDVANQLIQDGQVSHAYLGLTVANLDADIADLLNLPVDHGALVQEVVPGGPADDAGIEGGRGQVSVDGSGTGIAAGGDVIVAIDGDEVSSGDDVVAAVDSHQPGDQVDVELVRNDGQHETVTATLTDRPDQVKSAQPEQPQQQQLPQIPGLPPGFLP